MIDLTKKTLPDTVYVSGKVYHINTDFQYWIRFEQIVASESNPDLSNFDYLYKDSVPQNREEGYYCLLNFFFKRNQLPRVAEEPKDNIIYFDYALDSDYIYAAFFEQYHIDLIESKLHLHWYKFKALFNALHNTRFNEIEGYRAYQPNIKPDTKKEYLKLKEAWKIEPTYTKEEEEKIKHFESLLKQP